MTDHQQRRTWLGLLAALTASAISCGTIPLSDQVLGPSYQPTNVYVSSPRLPERVRRVAILPLVVDASKPGAESGQESLAPILEDQLVKTKKFEVVQISPEQLRQWTGQGRWAAEDKLPQDLFQTVHEQTGADAILFVRLTQYRAYPPLAVGWRLKLVDCLDQRVWWAVDEVFDAGETRVANGARRFQQTEQRTPGALLDSMGILASPRRFGQYAAATAVATLPER